MREIKFRAWHKADKKMYDVIGFSLGIWFLRGKTHLMPRSAIELLQYTGLKDKNCVEIYEGDVVEVKLVDGHENFEVYYAVDEVKFTLVDCNGDRWGLTHSNDIKVIGHTYEGR